MVIAFVLKRETVRQSLVPTIDNQHLRAERMLEFILKQYRLIFRPTRALFWDYVSEIGQKRCGEAASATSELEYSLRRGQMEMRND